MRRTIVGLAGAVVMLGLGVAPAAASSTDLDCDDFATQAEAVAALGVGDPHGLDADNDGVPCETQFGATLLSGSEPAAEPGEESSAELPRTGLAEDLALAGGLLVAGGAGLVMATRRRGRHVLAAWPRL